MENKIEIGEYIRSKEGFIGKVEDIIWDKQEEMNYYICEKDNVMAANYRYNILNHSKNIIELIEKGDYVNGDEVLDKYLFNGEKPVLETSGDGINCKCLCNSDIKSIVTREQFNSAKYIIPEEK